MKLNLKLLKKLYSIDHPSGAEHQMMSFIINYCYKIPNLTFELDHYNNIFIIKNTTDPKYYPCIVAHMDQIVTNKGPYGVYRDHGIITGYHLSNGSQCSLGADDANGICVALQMLNVIPNLKVIFTVQEEIGGIGAEEATLNYDFLKDINFFVQADRRGSSDLITFTNGIESASHKFVEDIKPLMDKYGYKEEFGTFTDIGVLAEYTEISGVNISCGYYHEHTIEEFTVIKELQNCLLFIQEILLSLSDNKPYKIDTSYNKNYYRDYFYKNNYKDVDEESDFNFTIDEPFGEKCLSCKSDDCMHCKYYD